MHVAAESKSTLCLPFFWIFFGLFWSLQLLQEKLQIAHCKDHALLVELIGYWKLWDADREQRC